jgi:hypothetical protein
VDLDCFINQVLNKPLLCGVLEFIEVLVRCHD